MVEIIGDIVQPDELVLPGRTSAQIDLLSGLAVTSGLPLISGLIFLNRSTSKLEFWTGTEWQVVTSATAR